METSRVAKPSASSPRARDLHQPLRNGEIPPPNRKMMQISAFLVYFHYFQPFLPFKT